MASKLLLGAGVRHRVDLGATEAAGDVEPEEAGSAKRVDGVGREAASSIVMGRVAAEDRADATCRGHGIEQQGGDRGQPRASVLQVSEREQNDSPASSPPTGIDDRAPR